MGISTEVVTIFGWKISVNKLVMAYLDEIDYGYPAGVVTDYDCNNLWMGAVMFTSGDARWGEMYGESSFSIGEAREKFCIWAEDNTEFASKILSLSEGQPTPMFHSFVNFS